MTWKTIRKIEKEKAYPVRPRKKNLMRRGKVKKDCCVLQSQIKNVQQSKTDQINGKVTGLPEEEEGARRRSLDLRKMRE